ncbi:EAL domain-containing protein [Colwellia sp. MB02u-9]|uniref:EAL domain-containing protein n=1 Tax=Colwellia sp. MB02u-9 TaxID=2759823 RepID=UPI0015F5FF47|nr:EAL domain-containing protein [Colwellia sp. MB02u-9]MBA6294909.1 EAL domain-containing protein [Colwellia sp. MB02u-9]
MLLLFFKKKLISQFRAMFAVLALVTLLYPYGKILASENNINTPPLKFDRISIAEGLSQSYVYDIIQDNNGFIWIATQDGLNRYDGKNFVYYRHDSTDKSSIAGNFIRKLFIDKQNIMWVGTNEGLSRYNEALDSFDNFFHQTNDSNSLKDNEIWDIYQDQQNDILVSTKEGLHKYDQNNKNFSRIRIRGFDSALREIKTIFQDNKGNYWLGTYDKGIYLANSAMSFLVPLSGENKWNLSINATGLFDLKIIDNQYWLATDNGLFVISQEYKIKKHYSANEENVNGKLLSNNVRAITLLNESAVWLGTLNGLNIINLLTGNIDAYQTVQHKNAISNNYILKLFKDSADNIWIGTDGNGINTFNSLQLKIRHGLFNYEKASSAVYAFAESEDGRVWFATDDGKLSYLNAEEKIVQLKIGNMSTISHLMLDNKDNFWLRTEAESSNQPGSLYYFNTKTLKLTENKFWKNNSHHTNLSQLFLIKNKIWFIDSKMQLASFNIQTNQFETYVQENGSIFTTLKYDDDNRIWLSTNKGEILNFNVEKLEFSKKLYLLSDRSKFGEISTIAISNEWIWLGSRRNGLAIINKKNSTELHFNEKNGLSNNFIADIVIDSIGTGWLSTNIGINSVDPKNKLVKSFNKDMLISDNEYISDSSILTSGETIFFGGINGFHTFIPQEVSQIRQRIPTPIISNILIANKEVPVASALQPNAIDKEFHIENSPNHLTSLNLQHIQSQFSIEFVAPNAKLPNQINYRYRLVGLDENWIDAGKNNQRATYTNLSPGDYTFEVQAYDLQNNQESAIKTLNITIMPPWWLSPGAIFFYSLIALLIFAYILQQIRHKRLYHLQIKLSEERLKLSLWGSGDEMWDWNIKSGKIFRSNIWGVLEFPQDGKRNVGADQTNIHQHDIPRVREALNQHMEDNSEHFEATYRVKDKDEKWIWVLDRGKIVERDEKNKPSRMTGTLKDISQIKRADERLKLFAKCIENISDAIVIYDRQFTVVDINQAFQNITGKNKLQMQGTLLNFDQYPDSFNQKVKQHLMTKGNWHGEIKSKRDNGEIYSTDFNIDIIRDDSGNISHFVGVFSDITKRKQTEAELRKLANTDTLTGLPNRAYFQANQQKLVSNKVPHALLVFDLDNFKKVNDSLGHEVGDVLLCKVAERIKILGRNQDTVYRLGGDEFSLIVENTNDLHTITHIAKEVLKSIALPLRLKSQEIVLYSSIGIVIYPEDGASPQELLKNADTAMYHAKNTGGNKYQFFSDSMNKTAVKRLQIESLIRHGLKEDLFSVFYQPKIEIATGKIAGMEALVRFETPNKGIISPVVFIPVSEETGQIIDIGEIVLRKACFATKKWVDTGLFDGRVAVNLSAVQFTQPNLVAMIADTLKESGLLAKYLELEITEGTVMDSPQKAIDTMLQIRAMGIHLSLDDFGTGYSSLAYLKKFPLNTLKIDKAFVDDIETSEQGRNMVATIVTIAHNLGMQVVAEGVETNQQLSFLSGLRCEQLQGYLYSKPLPKGDFQKYLLSFQIANKSTSFGKNAI